MGRRRRAESGDVGYDDGMPQHLLRRWSARETLVVDVRMVPQDCAQSIRLLTQRR